jgi:hypothetical protein
LGVVPFNFLTAQQPSQTNIKMLSLLPILALVLLMPVMSKKAFIAASTPYFLAAPHIARDWILLSVPLLA